MPTASEHPDLALVDACTRGDAQAQRTLMLKLVPVLRSQAGRTAARFGRASSGPDAQDLVQDTLVELLRDGAQELRRWNPDRGLSLEAFVRLVARRLMTRRLARHSRRDARTDSLDVGDDAPPPAWIGEDQAVEQHDELDAILQALHQTMTPRDRELFERVFLLQEEPTETARALQMSADALKKWRSRLYARARAAAARLDGRRSPAGSAQNRDHRP